jgi:tetratricopeptide (TPR) repeat protein
VEETRTIDYKDASTRSGAKGTTMSLYHKVVELSESPLDPSLFLVPKGFTKVTEPPFGKPSAQSNATICPGPRAQGATEAADWKAELAKAQEEIRKNSSSAFWHGQAGVLYCALGNVAKARSELEVASQLDPGNPLYAYELDGIYEPGALAEQRDALASAIGKDPANPFGHFQLGAVLAQEGRWAAALREFLNAKQLISESGAKGEYMDPRGNIFPIGDIRDTVDVAIERVANLMKEDQRGSRSGSLN